MEVGFDVWQEWLRVLNVMSLFDYYWGINWLEEYDRGLGQMCMEKIIVCSF